MCASHRVKDLARANRDIALLLEELWDSCEVATNSSKVGIQVRHMGCIRSPAIEYFVCSIVTDRRIFDDIV